MNPITDADAPNAALTRLVARDELADLTARLHVVREQLTAGSPGHSVVGIGLLTAQRLVGQVVAYLSESVGPNPHMASCSCGHTADDHVVDLDTADAWVVCLHCSCCTWSPQ